ncbi:MAG: PHP domain-containing protein [Ignavibacteria bacterium]|jgi:hypothetical protein
MYEYVGAFHIHSEFSDGSGTVEDICGFADEVGLDYIVLTDHNTLRAKKEGYEKWYGNTLLIVGCEINDKENKNHLLAIGIDEAFSTRLPAKEYTKKVKDSGGMGIIAHPHEKRSSMKEHPPFPWLEWDSEDFDGIEIWNHMSEWMEGLTEDNKYNYFVHPLRSIVAPPKETLDKWDEINLRRKLVGIGGIDAHAHKINLLGFFEVEVFPYKVLYKSVRTHILTDHKIEKSDDLGAVKNAQNLLLDSLKKGQCFVSNYYYGDAKGFRFFAECEGRIYQMGDTFDLCKDSRLRVLLPNITGTIKLLRNGVVIDEVENIDAEFIIKRPGAYRVEVYIENKAWIFSNHVRIGL